MPGRMGGAKRTVQNLKVLKVDKENNLLLVMGAVPGCKNSLLLIKEAKKRKGVAKAVKEEPKVLEKKEAKPKKKKK